MDDMDEKKKKAVKEKVGRWGFTIVMGAAALYTAYEFFSYPKVNSPAELWIYIVHLVVFVIVGLSALATLDWAARKK